MYTDLALFSICVGISGSYTALHMVFADLGGWKGLDTGTHGNAYDRLIRARLMFGMYGPADAYSATKAAFFTALLLAGCGVTALLVKIGLIDMPRFGPVFAVLAGSVFVFIGSVSLAGFTRTKNLWADMVGIDELELICQRAGYIKSNRRRPRQTQNAGTAV